MAIIDDLVAYWALTDAGSPPTTADDSHGSLDGTNMNITVGTSGGINNGRYYSFNGTSSDVNMGTSSSLRFTTAVSVSVWFRSTSTASNMRMAGNNGYSSAWYGYYMGFSGGQVRWATHDNAGNNNEKYSGTGLANGQWHHAVGTFDSTNNRKRLYIDGVAYGGDTTWNYDIGYPASSRFHLGTTQGSGGWFNGDLNHVAVWSRELTSSEVSSIYNNGPTDALVYPWGTSPGGEISGTVNGVANVSGSLSVQAVSTLTNGLMGWWALDEQTGPTCYDSTSNDLDGTGNNVSYGSTGVVNSCYTFNGSSSYVTFGAVAQPTTAITISAWIRLTGHPSEEKWIIHNEQYSNNWFGYRVTIYQEGAWGYLLADGQGHNLDRYVATSDVADGQWHHIAFTWNGTTAYHYTDNVKVSGGNWIYSINYGTTATLEFGRALWNSRYFGGNLDLVGIWNRALSDAEIASLYNAGVGLNYPFQTGGVNTLRGMTNGLASLTGRMSGGGIIYYVSTSGNNSTGNGSQSNPWATLDYAIGRVSAVGSTIYVMAGTYPTISAQMELSPGVSIVGAGRDRTTITMTNTSGGGCIKMESYGQWANKTIGFQSISGIKFVGSTTSGAPVGHAAIVVYYRNHVYVHDCEFVDFVRSAVRFNGQQYWSGFNIPNPYYNGSKDDFKYIPFNNSFAEGNRFYNNIVHNCCGRITGNDFSGALEVSVNDGCLVYNNYMTATGRSGDGNGVPIKFIGPGAGFNRNSKIYNNHIIAGHMDTNYWQFAIEIWWDLGGTEIYGNTCEGALDLCDSWDQYGAGYGLRCYDNNIGYSQNTTNLDRGILFEGTHVDTYVYNNHIHHVARAITHNNNNTSNATIYNNVHVYNNLAHHLSGRSYQTWGMYWDYTVTAQGGLFQNIFIRHNMFVASEDAPDPSMFGIMIPTVTELDSWYCENNIIINFERGAIHGKDPRTRATNIFIRNNLIWDCYNNNDPVYEGGFPTAGVTYSGTVKSSPQFISSTDFHLQPTSPAIGAGRPTDVTLDYDGNTRSSTAPTIGAYEYTATGITYYVRTDGVNTSSRNGLSPSTAWATLSYASSRVSQSGSTIYVESGNYTDNNRVNLAVGVNVVGNSTTRPNITTSYSATSTIDGYLYLNSASGNAINGNQSISYLRINGNNTNATRAGSVNFRGNVKIHHCEISNFLYSGIRFYGSSSNYNVTPTNVLPTGNEVYNCVFNNCSQRVGSNIGGHIRSECQVGFLLHHNTFIQNSRPVGYNGNIFSGYQNWGLQVYNNVWTKPDNNYTDTLPALDTWNFFMEFHYSHGGIDIYNNEFIGVACVDFAGVEVDEDHYTYGGRVFENTFRSASGGFAPYNPHNEPYIDLESFSYVFDVAIYRNKFSYGRTAIALNNVYSELNYVDIYSNIIENTGNLDNGWDNAIYVSSEWAGSTPVYFSNISIVNNVITAGRNTLSGVGVNVLGTMYRLIIKNNIIYGTFSRPIRFTAPSSITTNQTYIQNNIFYGNNNTSIYYDPNITFLNLDESGNLAGSAYNPIFVGGSPYSYRLSSTSSPAYHAGRYHKILVDFDGNAWNNPPSIGAYEYETQSPSVPDNFNFCLSDVVAVVEPSVECLDACFDEAIPSWFDPAYEGDHTCLSNFRNYGAVEIPTTGIRGLSRGVANVWGRFDTSVFDIMVSVTIRFTRSVIIGAMGKLLPTSRVMQFITYAHTETLSSMVGSSTLTFSQSSVISIILDDSYKVEVVDFVSQPYYVRASYTTSYQNVFLMLYRCGTNYNEIVRNVTRGIRYKDDNTFTLWNFGTVNYTFKKSGKLEAMVVYDKDYFIATYPTMPTREMKWWVLSDGYLFFSNNPTVRTVGAAEKDIVWVDGHTTNPVTLTVTPSSLEFLSNGTPRTTNKLSFTTNPLNRLYYVLITDAWISIERDYSNVMGNNTVSVSTNPGVERTGTFIARSMSGYVDVPITILQRAAGYQVAWLGYISLSFSSYSSGTLYFTCKNESTTMNGQTQYFYWQTRDNYGEPTYSGNFHSGILNAQQTSSHSGFAGGSFRTLYGKVDTGEWQYLASF